MPRPGAGLVRLLADRGVPERAARIYIAACREGPQTASELARVSGNPRVETYRYIQQLHEAGLLRSVGGRPMRFAALPPEELIDRWIRTTSEDLRRLESGRSKILREFDQELASPEAEDGRKYTVLDQFGTIRSFLRRRIGLAKREILLSLGPFDLPRFTDAGLDRELRSAHQHKVRVRVLTEIHRGNLMDAKHFSEFSELKHSRTGFRHRGALFDRLGALVYVTSDQAAGNGDGHVVALWTTEPDLLRLTREQYRQMWAHAAAAAERIVELEEPPSAALPIRLGREVESFNRLRDITQLGMQIGGLTELPIDLPDFIDTLARQVGREVSRNLEGALPLEVARSLREYYRSRGVGFEILQPDPLLIRTDGCIACDGTSPEVGRLLCPALLRAIFETRTGGRWEVERPEAMKLPERGHVFAITAV